METKDRASIAALRTSDLRGCEPGGPQAGQRTSIAPAATPKHTSQHRPGSPDIPLPAIARTRSTPETATRPAPTSTPALTVSVLPRASRLAGSPPETRRKSACVMESPRCDPPLAPAKFREVYCPRKQYSGQRKRRTSGYVSRPPQSSKSRIMCFHPRSQRFDAPDRIL